MAFVYWIHTEDHFDIYSQGYVGITTRSVADRFKSHIRASRTTRSKDSNILKAILKHGDKLIVETVCEGTLEYVGFIENKLRPSERIGWNIAIGGNTVKMTEEGRKQVSEKLKGVPKPQHVMDAMNSARLSKPVSEETKRKTSESLLGRTISEETKAKMRKSHETRTSYPRTKTSIESHIQTFLSKHPLDLPNINIKAWLDADFYYAKFNEKLSTFQASNINGIPKSSLKAMWKRFSLGWNPLEDQRWLEFKANKA